VTRAQLREFVSSRWGSRLERATLDELHEGLLELQLLATPPPDDGIFVIDDVEDSVVDYETAMRQFLGDALADESDGSFVHLWLTSLELWLAVMTRDRRGT